MRHTTPIIVALASLVAIAAVSVAAPAALAAKEPVAPAEQAKAAAAVAPGLVRVEYTLRVDKGEEPYTGGSLPSSAKHYSYGTGESVIEEDRPREAAGYLVSPTQVVTIDILMHPRFIESVAVRQGDEVVKARVVGWFKTADAVLIELEKPLKAAKPLAFAEKGATSTAAGTGGHTITKNLGQLVISEAVAEIKGEKSDKADKSDAAKKSYFAVSYYQIDGEWTIAVDPWLPSLMVTETGRKYLEAPADALVVDEAGTPVGLSMNGELPTDDSWQASPLKWPMYTEAERKAMLDALRKTVDRGIVRATLHFRSPKNDPGARYRGDDDDEDVTESDVAAVILADGRVLVLADLRPKVAARLERIEVHPAEGEPVTARFEASLKDYGCFTARIEKPLGPGVAISAAPIRDMRFAMLPSAEVRIQGEERIVYIDHRRIHGFSIGWRRQIYPEAGGADDGTDFLFDPAGALVALPVAHREKVTTREHNGSAGEVRLTAASYLGEIMAGDLAKAADPHNVPLTEDAERRLAWLGLELQPLNKELARENKVSDLTRDGQTGALVSCVYPDSPAAKAGVEAGWILLRLQVEGQPKPLEVEARDEMDRGAFPWERLDEVQEQYLERIPPPWPSAENTFTRALTDLGFGTKFKAEFYHDGKSVTKSFEVVAGPPHFDSAPHYKAAALGLTVRDLTYEVRRYFQKKPDEPGVIVSKIEPGSKASIAGIKPYEIITHVNDKPVMNVKEFEEAVKLGAQADELRLSVKRMTQGRVVKINPSAPTPRAAPPVAPKAGASSFPAAGEGEGGMRTFAPDVDDEPAAVPPAPAPKSRPSSPSGKKAPGTAGG